MSDNLIGVRSKTIACTESICLGCLSGDILECFDALPFDYNKLIEKIFEVEQSYFKEKNNPNFKEHLKAFYELKKLIESPNPDLHRIRVNAINLQYISEYKAKRGLFF